MSSNTISGLYEDIVNENQEKTASEQNGEVVEFNAEFFNKLAAEEEAEVSIMDAFIDDAREQGHSDDDISAAIDEAMDGAGVKQASDEDEPVESEFDIQKEAAYAEGSEQAVMDSLEMAKEAGVTMDELADFDLGATYAQGYSDTRGALEDAIQKIAAHKKEAGLKETASNLFRKGMKSSTVKGEGVKAFANRSAGRVLGRAADAAGVVGRNKGKAAAGVGALGLAGGGAAYVKNRNSKK